MAFQKPTINVIKPDIKNLSIYLRSTKKFGKSTLFRDVILEKYGDPSRGLLVGCGNEKGYKMLDNLNATQIKTYKDLQELANWLINEKGKEHNIEMVAFDTGDELALIADTETIRQSNVENPNKKCKSIKAAFGGYTAGEKYSANDLIKPYMTKLEDAGFGIWVIAHTKFKTIKEKGGLEEDGYMQLSSNMGADYEAAFGDIFDVTLTGVIDRNLEERKVGDKVKKYATNTVRKLYFRGTTLIDAGGRFAYGAVPEYMVFDKPNMAADFIRVVEEGMEKSKSTISKKATPVKEEKIAEPDPVEEDDIDDIDIPVEDTIEETTETSTYPDDLDAVIRKMYKECKDAELKVSVKNVIAEYGKLNDVDEDGLKRIYDMMN
ncbi:AAA family ATPase [Eubacterium sp.]|uniref:AAA family ATPase n=1 Tax=Eubacterium sp. TaxID=142586 RepID=UPI001DF88A1A|nr:AAA family ATPase [Eubacterium sp.]MBS5619854.1 AAA family ATPase [Eubacterium sp.]